MDQEEEEDIMVVVEVLGVVVEVEDPVSPKLQLYQVLGIIVSVMVW